MFRCGLLFLILWLGSLGSAFAVELLQRDWMEQLADGLGWGYGLPDDPVAEDYIALLSGRRELHVEVEENHRRSDLVAVKRLTNFGPFSGSGWASGRREPAQLHLDVLVPHNGRYRLTVVTRLPGVRVQLAGQEFTASAGEKLTRQELGTVNLTAGQIEIQVTLPPNAGIDYLQLSAPPLPAIAPLDGWKPDQLLETADLALTMLQALDLMATLPPSGRAQNYEAESVKLDDSVELSRDRHLGVPSGNAWVRARHKKTNWQMPLSMSRSGCYQLLLRGSSTAPLTVDMDGVFAKQVEFGQTLENYSLGNYCLPRGDYTLVFELPPWAGVDSLIMRRLDTSSATLTRLLGLPNNPKGVERQQVNELLQLLASLTH